MTLREINQFTKKYVSMVLDAYIDTLSISSANNGLYTKYTSAIIDCESKFITDLIYHMMTSLMIDLDKIMCFMRLIIMHNCINDSNDDLMTRKMNFDRDVPIKTFMAVVYEYRPSKTINFNTFANYHSVTNMSWIDSLYLSYDQ